MYVWYLVVCTWLDRGLSLQDLADFVNENQCNVIQGSLILQGAFSETLFTPLSSIVEITGNLFVRNLDERIDNLGQILPNLAVIRANPYYRHLKVNSGLSITNNSFLNSISLTNLTHILGNNIHSYFCENRQLQYIYTVDWKAISNGSENVQPYCYNSNCEKGDCSRECEGHCWNHKTCQNRGKLTGRSRLMDCKM